MSIEEFCGLHRACDDGRQWALENCVSMEDAWGTLKYDWLIWVATRPGVLTNRELRKFAVWSARQVQHLMTDPRSVAALEVAERHAEGLATDAELKAAWAAAWDAAGAVAGAVARAVAWAAAWAVSKDAAAGDAARAAAWAAAWAVAKDAAAGDAAKDARAAWLRENTKPNFGKTK